ncbi:MAG TPA: hypothetical protein H9689_01080 [Firmicutes bacterium]|nr:hypothetical protein [Bacillota bacterium]
MKKRAILRKTEQIEVRDDKVTNKGQEWSKINVDNLTFTDYYIVKVRESQTEAGPEQDMR